MFFGDRNINPDVHKHNILFFIILFYFCHVNAVLERGAQKLKSFNFTIFNEHQSREHRAHIIDENGQMKQVKDNT